MSNVETLPVAASNSSSKQGQFEPLTAEEIRKMNAYWRACNYLSAGMLYLCHNPLFREPLKSEHIKNRLLGHWGSDPCQSFIWVHMNRLIKKYDLDAIYISGPGHGAPATLSNCSLEGVYSEVYPEKSQDVQGLQKFLKQFSFPGGIGSHCTPETPRVVSRGRRAGIQHLPWVWSGIRQPRPDRDRGGWRQENPRPGLWPPVGTPTNFLTRCATGPCSPSCI